MKYESVWHVCLPACMCVHVCVCVGVPRQTAWDLCLFPFSTPLATESSRSEYVHTELLAHHCSVCVCFMQIMSHTKIHAKLSLYRSNSESQ